MMSLAEIKAIAADHNCTVVLNEFAPLGKMLVIDPVLAGMGYIAPGLRVLVVNPDDCSPRVEAEGENV